MLYIHPYIYIYIIPIILYIIYVYPFSMPSHQTIWDQGLATGPSPQHFTYFLVYVVVLMYCRNINKI